MAQSGTNPLSTIDGNSQSSKTHQADSLDHSESTDLKAATGFSQDGHQQQQALHNKLFHQQKAAPKNGSYVSPSDNILSPASAKLSAFKERRFAKSAKPRTLFAKSNSSVSEESAGATTSADSSNAAGPEGDLTAPEHSK